MVNVIDLFGAANVLSLVVKHEHISSIKVIVNSSVCSEMLLKAWRLT